MTIELPPLPTNVESFLSNLEKTAKTQADVVQLTKPYIEYESRLRQIYAQEPNHPAIQSNHLVSIFNGSDCLTIRARELGKEDKAKPENFILALADDKRRKMDPQPPLHHSRNWSNIVVSGSAVLTALLPVDAPHDESKRALRSYYHEQLAPASDVDIFAYGLNEKQAIEKIEKIETNIRDAILSETTTIRTKNTITIVSEYPTRHVQIVLRLYNSISEVLTGFDVDCACVAYDGKDVWASPRALAALATQTNSIDLTRRSPSYENRLSKYAHRGFEIYWPGLDRSRVDPTIYERSFARVMGLARLLVFEKLPYPIDRDQYLTQRRSERGRPDLPWNARYRHTLPGNIKDSQPDDVPEWYDGDEISSYHTFTIPYGPKYSAGKIEKLVFKKDLLLNAEWNKPKDRKTNLHRHPAFFGRAEDVIQDCCGFCPKPTTDEDLAALEEESKSFISGEVTFMQDDPGRQAIGSFHPLTAGDWTDMAYVGSTSVLCQAIVNDDLEGVKDWFAHGGDVNRRDHTGRTPLHLACTTASLEIVQYLIDHDARLVARLYNGMTALHMAAHRGNASIVKALLQRSQTNEEEEDRKEELRKNARRTTAEHTRDAQEEDSRPGVQDLHEDSDYGEVDETDVDEDFNRDDTMTEGSFIKVPAEEAQPDVEDINEPDFYDVDVLAWDAPVSPLHLAIIAGNLEVIELLISEFAADVLSPVKLMTNQTPRQPRAAILSMVLPLELSLEQSNAAIKTLVANGASAAQADMAGVTAFHYIVSKAKSKVVDLLQQISPDTVNEVVLNHLCVETGRGYYNASIENPLLAAIRAGSTETCRKLLSIGAKPEIDFKVFARAQQTRKNPIDDPEQLKKEFYSTVNQPVIEAAKRHDMVDVIRLLLDAGADVNSMNKEARIRIADGNRIGNQDPMALLDMAHARVKSLQEFTTTEKKGEPPIRPDPVLPSGLGDYGTWLARGNLATANVVHELHLSDYLKDTNDTPVEDGEGEQQKVTAVRNMRTKYEELAFELKARKAKTFLEICSDAKNDQPHQSFHAQFNTNRDEDKAWVNQLSFTVPDLTEDKKKMYLRLFEAAYAEDTETVKLLCLKGEHGKLPLQVAVQDLAGFSPFSIAIIRGHTALANTIIDIAKAQYAPLDEDAEKYKYTIRQENDCDCESYSSDSEDEQDPGRGLQFVRELADARFTIDDILTRAKEVRSKVSPTVMVSWNCEVWRASRGGLDSEASKALYMLPPRSTVHDSWMRYQQYKTSWPWFHRIMDNENSRCRISLVSYAIVENDMMMLQYLLRTHKSLLSQEANDNAFGQIRLSDSEISLAYRLGRTEMIGHMIERTGVLLPLESLAKSSGIHIERKHKYYQGLSVHGKKRTDWTIQGRDNSLDLSESSPPLLQAIFSGNLDSAEYILSDTPLRLYESFADAFADDQHVKSLLEAEGGLGKALSTWMNTRSHLTLHIAVMAPRATSVTMLKYLLRRLPQFLDSKSRDGETPLYIAFKLRKYAATQLLISAGADQPTRNKQGENLMHTIYNHRADPTDIQILQDCVSMLDPENVKRLLVQRCKSDYPGSQTPLAVFCEHQRLEESCDVLDTMLEYSNGQDLHIMDGAGDYILHGLVRQGQDRMAIHLASKFPQLLFVENATGMTPLDTADTAWLKAYINVGPPKVPPRAYHYGNQDKDIIDRPASNFLKDPILGNPSPKLSLRDTLRRIASDNPHPRKLVSLLDANEIARRLAERQAKYSEGFRRRNALGMRTSLRHHVYDNVYDRNKKERDAQDEVGRWWDQALKNQEEVGSKAG